MKLLEKASQEQDKNDHEELALNSLLGRIKRPSKDSHRAEEDDEDERIYTDCLMGVTIALPNNKTYKKMKGDQQRETLDFLLYNTLKRIKNRKPATVERHFERCQNGNLHLHAIINCEVIDRIEFMLDYAKTYHQLSRKIKFLCNRYNKYDDRSYNEKWKRYRSVPLCLQIYDKDTEQYDEWITYIRKDARKTQSKLAMLIFGSGKDSDESENSD